MRRGVIAAGGVSVPVIESRVCIVGSGAAALNAAVHLRRLGVDDVIIVTERVGGGVSANAGSDKQTYYRTNPAAAGGDGVRETAEALFSGGAMHGDIALVEAALSEREFYHLVELGVDFPHDRYGLSPGYRTDHDTADRGTSAGPRTSIEMVARLADEVKRLKIPIVDGLTVVELITDSMDGATRVAGLVGLERPRIGRDDTFGLAAVIADYIVYAVGGPGGLFRDSVYPPDQVGGLGAPLAAGAAAVNLTESQFGIASTGFRWNLSGSYQQVLPRYISTDPAGGDVREFLNAGFPDADRLFTAQFLKGYQWPFDVRKLSDYGSSLIDLLVFEETVIRGRRAFTDFSQNPVYGGVSFSMESAPDVVRQYLTASGAVADTPAGRLQTINRPARELFLDNGIDLATDRVPIAVSHQHTNGGLAGSIWWETTIRNLFAVGECNGSHGIYRPGGAALNAGQVGSLRAAQMIAHRNGGKISRRGGRRAMATALERLVRIYSGLSSRPNRIDPDKERDRIQRRMSRVMGIVRNVEDVVHALEENREMIDAHRSGGLSGREELLTFVKNEDLLISERVCLASAKFLLGALSGARGSFLVGRRDMVEGLTKHRAGTRSPDVVPDESMNDRVLECVLDGDLSPHVRLVGVRPIPNETAPFERTWAAYRDGAFYHDIPFDGGTP
jgi:succinate dehydrogenase/fumarate reductase flavoprotein subunit